MSKVPQEDINTFYRVLREFNKESAQDHLENHLWDWKCDADVDDDIINRILADADYEYLADEFEDKIETYLAEEDVWAEIIEDYVDTYCIDNDIEV